MGKLRVVPVPLAPKADSGEFAAGAENATVPNKIPRSRVLTMN
jgi:hypothetical protein